jgi:hypothetical protein
MLGNVALTLNLRAAVWLVPILTTASARGRGADERFGHRTSMLDMCLLPRRLSRFRR